MSDKPNKIYMTPLGPFEQFRHTARIFGICVKSLSRRLQSKHPKYKDWYVIEGDIPDSLRDEVYYEEDTCQTCNRIDDLLFKEKCWLLKVDHDHKNQRNKDVTVFYEYLGVINTVNYKAWMAGERPHLNKVKQEK